MSLTTVQREIPFLTNLNNLSNIVMVSKQDSPKFCDLQTKWHVAVCHKDTHTVCVCVSTTKISNF